MGTPFLPAFSNAQNLLKINEIEAFRAVMLRGTATDAAVLLHSSQPVVSKLIARFQRRTGIKLFELRKARLVPTPDAWVLFNTIERTYVGLDHVAQTIAELQGGHSGRLTVGSLPSFGMGPLSTIAAQFIKDEPDIQISVETVNSSLIRHSVLSGKVDMGIALKSIDTAGVDVEPLIEVRTVCVMNKAHPLASKPRVRASDLEGLPMILPSRDSASYTSIAQLFVEERITPRLVAETSYAMTMCLLAMQGAGVALVSPFAATHLVPAGLVVKAFEPALPIPLVLLTASNTALSRIATQFVERLKSSLNALRPSWE